MIRKTVRKNVPHHQWAQSAYEHTGKPNLSDAVMDKPGIQIYMYITHKPQTTVDENNSFALQ